MRSFLMMIAVLFTLALSTSTAHAQKKPKQPPVQDITLQVGQMIDGAYYKITGPFGQSYFVTGEDMEYKKAIRTVEGRAIVTKIYIEISEPKRGAQFIKMPGAQVEFTPKPEEVDPKAPKPKVPPKKPETKIELVKTANQSVLYNEPGMMVIVLGRPLPQPKKK